MDFPKDIDPKILKSNIFLSMKTSFTVENTDIEMKFTTLKSFIVRQMDNFNLGPSLMKCHKYMINSGHAPKHINL